MEDTQPAVICSKSTKETAEKRCVIYYKLTIKTPEQSQWRRSGVFIVNFDYMSQLFLVFLKSLDISLVSLLSTLNSYLRTATKKHSESCQTSEMELFTKIANGLSIIAISSILDVLQSYEYVLVLLWILLECTWHF